MEDNAPNTEIEIGREHEGGIGRAGSLLTSVPSDDSVLLGDIDAYVAQTDPGNLAQAELQLDGWVAPTSPYANQDEVRPGEGLVVVCSAQSESEAEIVMGVLEAAGIPASLDGIPSPIMGSIFNSSQARWGDVLVPEHLAADARAVLQPADDTAAVDAAASQDMST